MSVAEACCRSPSTRGTCRPLHRGAHPGRARLFVPVDMAPQHRTRYDGGPCSTCCTHVLHVCLPYACRYESMGGWETLSAAVESLYNRMRGDGRCASLFSEGNEQQLKTHMVSGSVGGGFGSVRWTVSIPTAHVRYDTARYGTR